MCLSGHWGGFLNQVSLSRLSNSVFIHAHIHAHSRTQETSIGGVIGTLARRASTNRRRGSQRGPSANEPPPDYPAVAAGRSFNLDELSDSDDDNAFTTEAPPDYDDLLAL